MKYDFDIDLHIQRFVKKLLQEPKMYAWIQSFLAPLKLLHLDFDAFRKKISYDLSFLGGETMVIESLLNDQFNGGFEGIYIENLTRKPSTVMYQRGNPNCMSIRARGYNKSSMKARGTTLQAISFIVYIPVAIDAPATRDKIKALINKSKMAGTLFTIENY